MGKLVAWIIYYSTLYSKTFHLLLALKNGAIGREVILMEFIFFWEEDGGK